MTKPWWHCIKDKESYDMIVSTGLAWELHEDLPLTWEEASQKLKELLSAMKEVRKKRNGNQSVKEKNNGC